MEVVRDYFLLFIIYSFIGWVMEVFFTLFTEKKLMNRGFYIGPYCPIYGVGCILILLVCSQYKDYPLVLFAFSVFIASILEYFTSYFMEKLFKARWWDYSNRKFNLNGRICLETMVPFGLIACFVIYVLNPFIMGLLGKLSSSCLNISAIVLLVLFVIDFIISFNVINNFKKTVKSVSVNDRTEDVNKYVKTVLLKKSILHRRLIKSFPKIQTHIDKLKEDFKKK